MNEMSSIAVPKPFWDELETALMIKSKELIKEIAKVLRQDEKKLLQEFKSHKTQLHLLDLDRDQEEEYECTAIVCTHSVGYRCRQPVLFGKKCCPKHEFFHLSAELKSKPSLHRIDSEEGTFFADTLTQQVYSVDYERVGYIQKDKCYIFEVEE